MRTIMLTLAGLVTGFTTATIGPGDEPPLQFELQIDGKKHTVFENKDTKITVGDKEVTAKITVGAHRRFNAGGVTFDYPSTLSFEYDDDGTWTLEGDDTLLLVNSIEGDAQKMAELFLGTTAEQIDEDAPAPKKMKFKLGGKEHDALRTTVSIEDIEFELTTVGLQMGDNCCVLLLQDIREIGGESEPETAALIESLGKTFAPAK